MCFQMRLFTVISRKPADSKLSINGQRVSILDCVGHIVYVATTQPCHHSVKAETEWGYVTLFIETGGGPDVV